MLKLFKKLDYLGHPLGFEIESSSRYKTWQGTIFSFIIFTVALCLIIMFGREIYERKTPNLFLNEEFDDKQFEASFLDLPFFTGFFDALGNNLVPFNSYFDATILRYYNEKEIIKTESNLTFTNCRTQKFTKHKDLINNLFKQNDYEFLCLNATKYTKTKGYFPQTGSSYIRVKIDFCDPNLRTDCKMNESVLQRLPVVANYYINSIVDGLNYSDPIRSFIDIKIIPLSLGILKENEYFYSNNQFFSDNGWILESMNKTSYLQIRNINSIINMASTSNFGENNKRSIYSYNIRFESVRTKINRSYLKIQELFARIGGVVNALNLIAKIISYTYFRFLYLKYIRESVINFQIDEEKEDETKSIQDLKIKKILKLNNSYDDLKKEIAVKPININKNKEIISNNNFLNSSTYRDNTNQIQYLRKSIVELNEIKKIKEEKEKLFKHDENIHFNYYNYLLYYFICFPVNSTKFIKEQIKLIEKFTEISNIYKVLKEKTTTTKLKLIKSK